jgi:hypothetical protein
MDLVGLTSNIRFTWPATFGRRHHSLPIGVFVPFHGDYIQMSFFPRIPNESPKILNDYIFFKSSLF